MGSLFEQFHALDATQMRRVHFRLCEFALDTWRQYARERRSIRYTETVVGSQQMVDLRLPDDAFASAQSGHDLSNVDRRYGEPIAALHDEDLRFPENIKYAYYSVYNLFLRYALGEEIDNWLIANQALSAETNADAWNDMLREALEEAKAETADRS